MKRIVCFLLAFSTLATEFVNAQTCPSNPTYKNVSGQYDLTTGKSIVLNSIGIYNITIVNNFSSTSSICVSNGAVLNLSFQNVNNIQKGGFINVDRFSSLTLGSMNNFPLTVNNSGTVTQSGSITYTDGATINNSGTYTITATAILNSGVVTFNNSNIITMSAPLNYNNGTFIISNAANSTISFSSNLILSNTTITNSGTINNSGAVTLQSSSVITNKGYMFISGDLSFSGATFSNYGVLYISGSTIVNSGSAFNNYCTIKETGNFGNNGTMSNTGNVILAGSFTNQGNFANGNTAQVQGIDFTNNGTVTGSGNFLFTGVTTNQGSFNGTSASAKINFYDASNLTSKYFDVQNTTPTNITKNLISAIIATLFTSCSDVTAPVITSQPVTQMLCDNSITSATFSVTATSNIAPTYQWKKNGTAISGATSSSYTATNLTFADTTATFTVDVTNGAGTTTSSSASVKYIIISQPAPLTQYLATGNSTTFSVQTSGATAWQWQKNGKPITGATAISYALPVVNYADSGSYTALVSYSGGSCTSNAAILKTSIVLYSRPSGNLNLPSTWGVATDGSGSSPLNFSRDEHTFVIANRASLATGASVTIAGKIDLANGTLLITPGSALTAGRIVRSLSTGAIAGSSSSSLTLTGIATQAYSGASDLYFTAGGDTLKNLITSAHTVTLHTALNLAAGTTPGILQVNSGTFATSDSLTLKSDIGGTASIAKSLGTITGKVTIEKFIHARRAWRLMGAPVTGTNAPSINAAWQEGAASSTDNPHPGYGTHITYGLVSDGFDQNPQKTFSMKVYNSSTAAWAGVPATKTTAITSYPAYLIFIRGNRSYNITTTTNYTAPMTTNLRVTGYVNQGTLPAKAVAATGLTLMANPYASPVNFAGIVSHSTNLKARYRVWDPSLAGTNGTGAWVVVDGSAGAYRATPPSAYLANTLEAGQGFFVESNDGKTAGSVVFTEDVKDQTVATTSADRIGDNVTADTSLEINLKLFNPDSTTAIADGVLFNFNAANSDSVDNNDALKMGNAGENLGIREGNALLSIDERTMPKKGDSLHLSLTNAKSASYQFEMVPSSLGNLSFALYDSYLGTLSPLSSTDTTRITFLVNNSIAASKAADRFSLVVLASKVKSTVLPLTVTNIRAYAKGKAITVEWTVANEESIVYYEVQKSADGVSFSAAGNVVATGASSYLFTDAAPAQGINYYRVKSVSKTGAVLFTNIVNAQMQTAPVTGQSSVSVYPNPLTGTAFTLTLANLAAGSYNVAVVNENGAVLFTQQITHRGSTSSQAIQLSQPLAAGVYFVKVTSLVNASPIIVKLQAQ